MSEETLREKEELKPPISFIEQFIIEDLKDGKNDGRIQCFRQRTDASWDSA